LRYTPKSELNQRVAKLQKLLQKKDIDGVIIIQNADLFYFTGTVQQSHLCIPAEGKPVLLVKKSYERAREESALDDIVYLDNLKDMLAVLRNYGYGNFKTLGFELDVLPVNLYLRYQKLFAPAKIVDASPLIRIVRMVKSDYELEIFRDAAKINAEVFSYVSDHLREGMSELKLNAIIDAYSREKGYSGFMRIRGFNQDLFQTMVVSGENTYPSYFWGAVGGKGISPAFAQGASDKPIGRNEPVFVDYGFILDGYILDQTRVYCIGELPDHLAQAYGTAVEILKQMEKLARPGLPCGKLHDLALKIAGDSPFAGHFTGYPTPLAFVGHGIGIELDELPVIGHGFETPLEPGMVIALEPKFTFPDGAVGIENTYVVTQSGLETVTVYDEGIQYL